MRPLLLTIAFACCSLPSFSQSIAIPGSDSRLRFTSYDIDPRAPHKISVAVNTSAPNGRGRSQFVKVGETIRGTTLKVSKLDQKRSVGANGIEEDHSELVLTDTATNATLVVPISKVIEVIPGPKR